MDFLKHVKNYDPNVPAAKLGSVGFRWSLLFLMDYAFSLSKKKDAEGNEIDKYDSPRWAGKAFRKLHERLVEMLIKQNQIPYQSTLPIPSIEGKYVNKEFFIEWAKKVNMPIVIRGYIQDSKIRELTTKDSLIENYGDREVKYLSKKALSRKNHKIAQKAELGETTLAEFLTKEEHENDYLNNFYGVLDDEDYQLNGRGNEIDEFRNQKSALIQWYISRVQNSGSPLHCALGDNMFLNVQGNKEWLFIHPSYLPLFRPMLDKYGIYVTAELEEEVYKKSDVYSDLVSDYSYLKHIPFFRYKLEPGDVLFNPSAWWHNVRNLSDYTVGCAVRYPTYYPSGNSPTISIGGLLIAGIKYPKKSILRNYIKMLSGDIASKKSFINIVYNANSSKK